jgi:hypothetical protein
VTAETDRAWLVQFLQKKADTKDGKKHGKEIKGTEAEINSVIDWLITQKKPA